MAASLEERKMLVKLIEENLRTQEIFLELGHCNIDGTEVELKVLADCKHLQTLVFANNFQVYEDGKWTGFAESNNGYSYNELVQIPPYLPQNLEKLNIQGAISDISFLQGLNKLKFLDLMHSQISNISFLRNLTFLTDLLLSFNKISDISFLSSLINLTVLFLENNEISNISLSFLNSFPKLKSLILYKNPIQNIPKEIFDRRGNVLTEVRTYLEDLEKGKSENKEVKIIFIGNGSVGKTQIAKRLCEQDNFVFNSQHHSTHAIALLLRKLAGFELNCWDFAGQDLYHATHRVFMQTRALLVLVWDFENENQDFHEWQGTKYENEKLLYWLEYAKCFAPKSPILVLQNKINTFPQDLYFEKKAEYQKEYPIVDFLKVSAETGKGFMLLEEQLESIFSEHKSFKTPDLPTNWVQIREQIREKQEKTTQKTLSISEFEYICEKQDAKKSMQTILGYLHDTGVFYYREGYFNDQIILDQAWAIEAIYKLLDRESRYFEILEHQNGNLFYKNICKIWANNTDAERKLFIDFMLSAELAFETTENEYEPIEKRTFAVPQLLPLEKPNDILFWEQQNVQNLQKSEISYRFLPKVFIQRFIVKANRFSEVALMWQKGLLLKTDQGSALVEACYEKEQQRITILSDNSFLIEKIKEELANIANEGKFQSKKGESENPKEKFGLNGLNPIFDKQNPNPMKEELNQIKKLIVEPNKNTILDALSNFIAKYKLTNAEIELLNLQSDYKIFQREQILGVLSTQESNQKNAKISVRILDLIEYLG